MQFLCSDLHCKKPKNSPTLSYLQSDVYRWKLPLYNNSMTKNFLHANNHVNNHANNHANKYITNKLL